VSVFTEGGRKGIIWLPKDHYKRGWQRFTSERQQLEAGQIKKTELAASPLEAPSPGVIAKRSFVKVLRSTHGVEAKLQN
jgi:hypothetical protein